MSAAISRAEREDILRVARQREKVAKTAARRRTAELKADFEAKLAAEYHFDQRPTWQAAMTAARKVVADADRQVAEECEKLGIPRTFRPGINVYWYERGENLVAKRRAQLRKVADSRLAAIERAAFDEIERASLEFSTEVISNGLSSRAQSLLASMPTIEALMPPLNVREVARALGAGPDALALGSDGGADDTEALQ